MDKRTPAKATSRTAVVAAMIFTLGSLAGARAASADPSGGAAPKKAPPATSRSAPPAAATDDPYRCHPDEDVACTIVRETTQGTLIVTMRPGRSSAATPAWTVISGAPPTLGPHPGGTVYVVPNVSPVETASLGREAALIPANGAPILE